MILVHSLVVHLEVVHMVFDHRLEVDMHMIDMVPTLVVDNHYCHIDWVHSLHYNHHHFVVVEQVE